MAFGAALANESGLCASALARVGLMTIGAIQLFFLGMDVRGQGRSLYCVAGLARYYFKIEACAAFRLQPFGKVAIAAVPRQLRTFDLVVQQLRGRQSVSTPCVQAGLVWMAC